MSGHEAYMQKCLRFLSGRTPPETGLFDFLSLTPLDLQKISAATALLGERSGSSPSERSIQKIDGANPLKSLI